MSEPSWEQADPTFPYLDEDPPVTMARAGLAAAASSVTPEPAADKDSED